MEFIARRPARPSPLLRFYDVSSGRVLLDGVDVRELDLGDLRSAIGLVSQDVFLFHGAVLADPPILVLDEATSAVDNETEAAIQRSLAILARGRTTLVVAHRLSTIRHADRIYVLADGRVVEVGDHSALLTENGVYASLWRVQTGEAV